MTYLLGMDEAGYGPNLGPLVISATAWHAPAGVGPEDLYDLLKTVVCQSARRGRTNPDPRLIVADSKAVHKPRGGLGGLERALFPALRLLGHPPTTWRSTWTILAGSSGAQAQPLPWYADYDQPAPTDLADEERETVQAFVRRGLAAADVGLVAMQSVAVFPREFNRLTTEADSKGHVLTHKTLELLKSVLPAEGGEPIVVVCDKHGGRNRYAAALQHHFPDDPIEILVESRATSVYRWGPPDARVEVRFQVGGERMLATALASMASKYLRELAMCALNTYWAKHIPGLRPTAGYPVDAKRFRSEIATCQAELGIADRDLWRDR